MVVYFQMSYKLIFNRKTESEEDEDFDIDDEEEEEVKQTSKRGLSSLFVFEQIISFIINLYSNTPF